MKKSLFMKARPVAAMAALALTTGLLFTACKKDKDDANVISDDEVAEAVTQSITPASGGLVIQTESTARIADTSTLSCGGSSSATLAGANVSGAAITYNYSLALQRSFVCVPSSKYSFSFTGSSSYSAPRMSSNDNSAGQFTITGFEPNATSYVFNSSYVRNGTQQSKVRLQRSFASVITITSSNINVDKTTKKITSGTATVSFEATGSGGYTVSRSATLTFLGNSKATLALKNGSSYNLTW